MLQKRIVQQLLQKHLHIRGENLLLTARKQGVLETPPHTWRKFMLRSFLHSYIETPPHTWRKFSFRS